MQVKYIDAHCHIQFEQYAKDDAELIERMRTEGVVGIVVGVDFESSKKAVALAEAHEHLFASIGLHPNRADKERYDVSHYRALAANTKVVAIGECGLDYYRAQRTNTEGSAYVTSAEATDEVKRVQREVLRAQIELAAEVDKPLIIHSRPSAGTQDAYNDLIMILKSAKTKYPLLRGDIHFFVGGIPEAQELIALGFTLSFTAVITFARDYDTVIRAVPLASILSETDAPYVAPTSRRGKRNDPLAAIDVVNQIAEIRGEDPGAIREALLANAQKLFGLPAS
ncbi:TPA: hydrolase TatD [Candidatus Kaiserbacteria bacterium]|nr:MAG: Hydrolase, TatD family [Parcubacteria group bacterium GW2011_GWA1_56_13]KKW47053.1 MAG: Hydrolase, TatD family [Parcubacteria group bacterium GW2011_GWB1_57_6]HCR52708.1 hydrolase TatD [Candidatus Kaiserbacteria bacterium]